MVLSCLPGFAQLGQLFFAHTSAPAPSNPTLQQTCNLNSLPYSSWRPPTCPQKCEGVCRHLPLGSDTLVNGRPVHRPPKELQLSSAEQGARRAGSEYSRRAQLEDLDAATSGESGPNAVVSTTVAPSTHPVGMDRQKTPDLTSLFDEDDDDGGDSGFEVITKTGAVDGEGRTERMKELDSEQAQTHDVVSPPAVLDCARSGSTDNHTTTEENSNAQPNPPNRLSIDAPPRAAHSPPVPNNTHQDKPPGLGHIFFSLDPLPLAGRRLARVDSKVALATEAGTLCEPVGASRAWVDE